MKNDPYHLHKLALKPLLSSSPSQELKTSATEINLTGENTFLQFLAINLLTPLWHESLATHDAANLFSNDFNANLKKAALMASARYLQQQHALNRTAEILDAEAIPYAVYKGAHIRELIYKNPAVRVSDDLDILVAKTDRDKTLQIFTNSGYELNLSADTISHEAVITDANTKIDLHWDLLRPGRTRIFLAEKLLAERQQFNNLWVLSPEAELFIMLVHPVITKYLTAPQAALIRVVDLLRWIETQEPDWQKVYDLLESSGLKTAAWINGYLISLLSGRTLPEKFLEQLKPSVLKGIHLQNWIDKNYSTKFLNTPFLIKAGFTLAVHDTVFDAIRAAKTLQRERRRAESEVSRIKSMLQK